jgi:diguanylate cyclase (GGDEF)-like protein
MRYSERILYVDDDPLACRSFARAMRQYGFIVDTAESGEEALEAARAYPYAVLAADFNMPGLDGIALVERVKKTSRDPSCVLVTGAWNMVPDDRPFGDLGIVDVIKKPWNSDALASTLRHALNEFYTRQRSLPPPSAPQAQRLLWLVEGRKNDMLENALRETLGYRITLTKDEADTVEQLEEAHFDAVILEIDEADLGACERIRRVVRAAKSAPVLALGSGRSTEATVAVVRSGAQDFLNDNQLSHETLHRSIQHAIERQRAGERLAHIAHHDPLTDLPNRALLEERLSQAVYRAKRRGRLAAVFYLDLDRFKPINDSLGHAAGDDLLRQVALRLKGSVRETDTVGRLGGDEFAVVLEELETAEEATLLAQRILNSFATTFQLEEGEVTTTTSIGIALHPHNGDSASGLLKCADAAMYLAKAGGRDNYRFYSQELHARAVEHTRLEAALRVAIVNEEFELAYQPQLRSKSHEAIGMEVLLRWQRPGHQVVMPSEFASLLDDTGLVLELGEWVLRRACQQVSAWNQSGAHRMRACVNVSAKQFESPQFAYSVKKALADYGLAPELLELEVQESVLLRDSNRIRTSFERLKSLGVRIAIDDFGTGYSSLTCLRRYKLDSIKVGRSFIAALRAKKVSTDFAAALFSVGRSLGLHVVAVGIERKEQLELVERRGCDAAQGYFIARPMSAANATRWLKRLARNHERRGQGSDVKLGQVVPLPNASDPRRVQRVAEN